MRRVLLVFLATSALAHSPDITQKMRDAQQAFAAGDCGRALTPLRQITAEDPGNYGAHAMSANCLQRQKDYAGAIGEFHAHARHGPPRRRSSDDHRDETQLLPAGQPDGRAYAAVIERVSNQQRSQRPVEIRRERPSHQSGSLADRGCSRQSHAIVRCS